MEVYNNTLLLDQTPSFAVHKKTLNINNYIVTVRSVGDERSPLLLIIHGSGSRSCSADYLSLLHEFIVRFVDVRLYVVAVDCPGYGESEGSRQTIRSYPTQFISQAIKALHKEKAFALMGHSQGGSAVFNAVVENPKLCDIIIQDRPVCGDLKRLASVKQPTLLVFDTEDKGHPISQGRIMAKYLPNNKFVSYTNSKNPYWHSDHFVDCVIDFLKATSPSLFPKSPPLETQDVNTTTTTTTTSASSVDEITPVSNEDPPPSETSSPDSTLYSNTTDSTSISTATTSTTTADFAVSATSDKSNPLNPSDITSAVFSLQLDSPIDSSNTGITTTTTTTTAAFADTASSDKSDASSPSAVTSTVSLLQLDSSVDSSDKAIASETQTTPCEEPTRCCVSLLSSSLLDSALTIYSRREISRVLYACRCCMSLLLLHVLTAFASTVLRVL